MKVTFLGTGTSQGVPVIACECSVCQSHDIRDKRLRSSISIETGGQRIIVDCGPDFRQQMLRENIRSIDAILVTHGHKDHLGGLDDVRAFNYINKRPAEVYASKEVQRIIKLEFSYAFEENPYPGVPEIVLHTISKMPFTINGQQVTPIKALHYGSDKFVFGFRIDDFTYITDAVLISDSEKKKIEGTKVMVVNALRKQKHYSHFNLEEAIAFMNEIKPEQGFLTHISHQMGNYSEVNNELPGFIRLAYDGLTITF
jgi:phosphoribosyl 1,2-cyclic phosphate phosphodiesterase